MSFNLESWKAEISRMDRKERAVLAEYIISTFDNKEEKHKVEESWMKEAEKRYQLYQEGKISSKLASTVFQDAFAKIK